MRITQGTFSYLPDFTDEEITAQIEYCLRNDWAVSVEHTDDPNPRNAYWDMWALPMFDLKDAAGIMLEVNSCRKTFPHRYIKVNGQRGEEMPIANLYVSMLQAVGVETTSFGNSTGSVTLT